ncbi:MAG TPA: hypothetical protein VGR35_06935 [Tepidisphaeraceae bacterium]|nr:hypothetical protein [Tepidisphaeraceae bacterium]
MCQILSALNFVELFGPRWGTILKVLLFLVISAGAIGTLVQHRRVGCAISVAAVVLVLVVLVLTDLPAQPADKSEAWDLARQHVERVVEPQSEAQYGSQTAAECVKEREKDHFQVEGWVEHWKHGRIVREPFRVDLNYTNGAWELHHIHVAVSPTTTP